MLLSIVPAGLIAMSVEIRIVFAFMIVVEQVGLGAHCGDGGRARRCDDAIEVEVFADRYQ